MQAFSPSAIVWATLKLLNFSGATLCLAPASAAENVYEAGNLEHMEANLVFWYEKWLKQLFWPRRYHRLRWLSWLLLSLVAMQPVAVDAQTSEASLRVAFIYNFIKFIEWPVLPDNELSLCTLEVSADTSAALAQIDNRTQQKRRIQVIAIDPEGDINSVLGDCELLYVTDPDSLLMVPEPLPAGLLLIVDEPSSGDNRVGIALERTAQNRIEFMINDAAIMHAGVKVSSQLLLLAKKRQRGRG